MALTEKTFHQLEQLYRQDRERARSQAQAIEADELAAWLAKRIGNPVAENHLMTLFFGESGVAADEPKAYRRFHRELCLRLRPRLQRNVLGWGEISQVVEVAGGPLAVWRHPETGAPMPIVYKKMPPFLHRADADRYVERYLEYNTVLRDEVGISVPCFDARITEGDEGQAFIFVIQQRVDPTSVGHEILRDASPRAVERLYSLILGEYAKFFHFNQTRAADGYQVGLDGQIPNWAVVDYAGDPDSLTGGEQLLYLDTNVPMIRIDGQDVVRTDMYFQALPGSARWLIKRLNLDQEVMDRYFEVRLIMLDFLGNIIVRHREELVPRLIEMSNAALAGPFAKGDLAPFTVNEVQKYYRSDVATWRLWRSLKLLGVISDGVSGGQWGVLKQAGEFYRIWTQPIF